jgi:hypothetical protein
MAEANLKGCHPIQNLGAVQTYIRRYLWITALEITDNDIVDTVTGKDEPMRRQFSSDQSFADKAYEKKKKLSEEQISNIKALAGKVGVSLDTVAKFCKVRTLDEIQEAYYMPIMNKLRSKQAQNETANAV